MSYRSRIVKTILVDASEIAKNPRNFRGHPQKQREALRGGLETIGIVKSLSAFYASDGQLTLFDGEARWMEGGVWPVEITDLEPWEADAVLSWLDKIGAGAEIDPEALMALLDSLPSHARQTAGAAWSDDELARIVAEQQPMPTIDELWKGMPEFEQDDLTGTKCIVHFENEHDRADFEKLIGQKIPQHTNALWHPAKAWTDQKSFEYAHE